MRGIHSHRPELVHLEGAFMDSDSFLREKCRAAILTLNDYRTNNHNGSEYDQCRQAQNDITHSLDEIPIHESCAENTLLFLLGRLQV